MLTPSEHSFVNVLKRRSPVLTGLGTAVTLEFTDAQELPSEFSFLLRSAGQCRAVAGKCRS